MAYLSNYIKRRPKRKVPRRRLYGKTSFRRRNPNSRSHSSYRKLSKPTRTWTSNRTPRRTRRLANSLTGLAEKKLIGGKVLSASTTLNFDRTRSFVMSIGTNLVPGVAAFQLPQQQLFTIVQGDGVNERNGRSIYIKQTKMIFNFVYKPPAVPTSDLPLALALRAPLYCRFIIFQPRTVLHGSQATWDITRDLFLDNVGTRVGINSLRTEFELSNWIINKNSYNVLRDQKFILGPPSTRLQADIPQAAAQVFPVMSSSSTSHYPSAKTIRHTITTNKNCRYTGDGTGVQPQNLNTDYFMICITAPFGAQFLPLGTQIVDNLAYNFIGTTSCIDL